MNPQDITQAHKIIRLLLNRVQDTPQGIVAVVVRPVESSKRTQAAKGISEYLHVEMQVIFRFLDGDASLILKHDQRPVVDTMIALAGGLLMAS